MTKKEIYAGIKTYFETNEFVEGLSEEVIVEFCEKEIATLDRKAEKSREAAAKRKSEGDALTALVKEALTDELQTIADITVKVAESDPEVTVAKVQYRLNQLAKPENGGVAEKGEIVIEGSEGVKSRKVVAYKLA